MAKSKAQMDDPHAPAELTVGSFRTIWLRDPDAAGRHFLTEGKKIADALFRRWRLAVDEADDAVQESFLRAHAHDEAALRRVPPEVLFAAWMRGLIKNIGRENVRRQTSERGEGPCERDREDGARARRKAQRKARTEECPCESLLALTPMEREAFDLYVEGLSTPQIAARLKISREAARDRVARAWITLANSIAGVVPVPRSALRALTASEKKTLSPRLQRVHALWMKQARMAAVHLRATHPAPHQVVVRRCFMLTPSIPPADLAAATAAAIALFARIAVRVPTGGLRARSSRTTIRGRVNSD